MNFIAVTNQVVIIFLLVIIGYVCKRLGLFSQEVTQGLSGLLLNVTIPCAIIASFNQNMPLSALVSAGQVLFCAFFIHVFAIVFGFLVYRKLPRDQRNVMWFTAVFPNCAFMGFPVMDSLLGKLGIFYGSMYVGISNIITWTFGQMLFTGERDRNAFKGALLNPGIVSIGIGLLVFLSPVKPPFVVGSVIDMVGGVTTPVAMMIIGAALGDIKARELLSGQAVYVAAVVRLVVLPFMTVAGLKAFGVSGDLLLVCSALTAMPAAAISVIFTERFNGDSVLSSRIVALSTILSVVTIPAVIFLL